MASPVIVRKMVRAGNKYVGGRVRTYEFLNYYNVLYDPPTQGDVEVVPQLRPGTTAGDFTLQVGIQAAPAGPVRRRMNIALVLDTSGSMLGARLSREKAVITAISSRLQKGDLVSLTTWNTEQQVLLGAYAVTGPDDATVAAIVAGLSAGGGTDLAGGLARGYELAKANYDANYLNRVVLVSDGEANVGQTSAEIIGSSSHHADGEGIYLVGVNVGDAIGDPMMNLVTDKGRGASVFVDTDAEAARMFADRFDETMEIAARGVRLELTLPWYLRLQTFSGEQSSTNPNEVEPQHLAPGDAMVFNQTFVACAASLVNLDDPITAKATWQTPLTHLPRERTVVTTLGAMLVAPAPELTKGSAIFAYAVAMRDADSLPSPQAKKLIAAARAQVDAANVGGVDPDLNEISELLATYEALF